MFSQMQYKHHLQALECQIYMIVLDLYMMYNDIDIFHNIQLMIYDKNGPFIKILSFP